MRYVTESVTIRGEVLGCDHRGHGVTAIIDQVVRRWRCGVRLKLEQITSIALGEADADDAFSYIVIDADAKMIVTRVGSAGERRSRAFPLRRFPSVGYLLDLPDELGEEADEYGMAAF